MQAGLALQAGRQPKVNPRFVVTNVQGGARRIYRRIYCQRGELENRIKELKAGVEMDRWGSGVRPCFLLIKVGSARCR